MQVCKYASMEVCTYIQICKYASMQVCTYMQVCKYAFMQVYTGVYKKLNKKKEKHRWSVEKNLAKRGYEAPYHPKK